MGAPWTRLAYHVEIAIVADGREVAGRVGGDVEAHAARQEQLPRELGRAPVQHGQRDVRAAAEIRVGAQGEVGLADRQAHRAVLEAGRQVAGGVHHRDALVDRGVEEQLLLARAIERVPRVRRVLGEDDVGLLVDRPLHRAERARRVATAVADREQIRARCEAEEPRAIGYSADEDAGDARAVAAVGDRRVGLGDRLAVVEDAVRRRAARVVAAAARHGDLARAEAQELLGGGDHRVGVHVVGDEHGLAVGRRGLVEAGAEVTLPVAVRVQVEVVERGHEPRVRDARRGEHVQDLGGLDGPGGVEIDAVHVGRERAVAVHVHPRQAARVGLEERGVEDEATAVDVDDAHALAVEQRAVLRAERAPHRVHSGLGGRTVERAGHLAREVDLDADHGRIGRERSDPDGGDLGADHAARVGRGPPLPLDPTGRERGDPRVVGRRGEADGGNTPSRSSRSLGR